MKHLFKKLMWWLLIILIIVALNASSIIWVFTNMVYSDTIEINNKLYEFSLWDSFKYWEKGLIYLFMFVGFILSVCFLKWVLQDTLQQHRERAKEKRQRLAEKKIKEKINEN